jgi:hypothetical protein
MPGLSCCWTCSPYVRRLPEDGTLVPKYVEFGTGHELCFMICVLLYFIECIYWLIC